MSCCAPHANNSGVHDGQSDIFGRASALFAAVDLNKNGRINATGEEDSKEERERERWERTNG